LFIEFAMILLRKIFPLSLLRMKSKLRLHPLTQLSLRVVPLQPAVTWKRIILSIRSLTTINKTFRKSREQIAQQLLIEYDQTAFGGILLQQPTQLSTDSVVPVPNVIIKWSNRLRTTAGRAHLQLHSIRTSKRKQRTLSRKEQALKMQQQQVQSNPKEPIINDCEMKNQCSKHLLDQQNSVDATIPQQSRRTAIVELSTKVVDNIQRLQTTLLHELCHVAAWIVDGNIKPPHGPYFQKWVQIATTAIPSITITTRHNFIINYKYAWKCMNPSCTVQIIRRHNRRSIDVERHVCGKCNGPIEAIHIAPPTTTSPQEIHSNDDNLNKNSLLTTSTSEQVPKQQLSEYQRFIQSQFKIVAHQIRQKQNMKLHNGSATLLLNSQSNRHRRRGVRKKIPSQSILKQCARLWQQHKRRSRK
jgi:predicted SprT family Zn-dependent metalloprotease